MKYSAAFALLFCSSAFIFQGCATIISSSKQKVTISSTPSGANILVDGDTVAVTPATVKIPRNRGALIAVEKDGYLQQVDAVVGTRFNPIALLNLPFTFVTWVFDRATGATRRLDKSQLDFALVAAPPKIEGAQVIYCDELLFNMKAGEKMGEVFVNKKSQEVVKFEETAKVDAAGLRVILNDRLKELGFKVPEPKGQFFGAGSSAQYIIKGEVVKCTYDIHTYIDPVKAEPRTRCEITIKWSLLNKGGELKHADTTTGIMISLEKGGAAVLEKATQLSFEAFLGQPTVYATVKQEYKAEDIAKKFELLLLNKPTAKVDAEKAITQATNSIVTVDMGESHGSGCVISDDGYIVTNLHVVGEAEKASIRFKSGMILEGAVVRRNKEFDLALIKVSGSGFVPIVFSLDKEVNVGADVYAIGTPASKQLEQTVSKGIISGVRKNGDQEYIQTDVSINPGNSGGGLVDKKGTLVGVVNAKLVGNAIEGIGFAIPAYMVFEQLKIAYKP